MNELALFAGAGGGILGGGLLGWRTVCAVEWEPYAAGVLAQRQNDGLLEPFPIWDDVQTFDGIPWRGCVDVVSGGFPCQDISCAGRRVGITGERSGMWGHMARIVRQVGPRSVFVENSPMLTLDGLGVVLSDLAALGFDAAWCVLSAADCGAPHYRERIWILAHALEVGRAPQVLSQNVGAQRSRREKALGRNHRKLEQMAPGNHPVFTTWAAQPEPDGMVDGVATDVDRLAAVGNGQVPRVAATAFRILEQRLRAARLTRPT
jgi:DNA (cytosine-5)-methyltransferase 1